MRVNEGAAGASKPTTEIAGLVESSPLLGGCAPDNQLPRMRIRVISIASTAINLRKNCQPVLSLFASSRRLINAIAMSTDVSSALTIMIRAYEVDHASEKSKRAHALATPLITTATAAHKAS